MAVKFGFVTDVNHFSGTVLSEDGEEIRFRRADGMKPDPRNPRLALPATERMPRLRERVAFEESGGLTSWWMLAESYERLGCSDALRKGA